MANLKSLNIDGELFQDKGTGTASGTAGVVGSTAIFESDAINTSRNWPMMAITYDSSNNKIVIAYEDCSFKGIELEDDTGYILQDDGRPDASDGGSPGYPSVSLEGSIISEAGNSNYGTAVVGTVYGTSISFGTLLYDD